MLSRNSRYKTIAHGGENMSVYSIREISDRVRPVAKEYGTGAIYLFGSYARGSATEESDVDLLVDAENVHGFKFFGLYPAFEEALGKPVDIVTMDVLYEQYKDDEYVSELRNAIEKDRRLIYDGKG